MPLSKPLAVKAKNRDTLLPRSFHESCKIPSCAEAIDRVFNALIDRCTFPYVRQTPYMDPSPFSSKFRLKEVANNQVLCKDRCCLVGNFRMPYREFDYETLYDPLVKHENIRLLMTKMVAHGLKVERGDIENTYLYGDIYKPIIMKQSTDSSGNLL